MLNPRIVGHIVAVQGFRVKVELQTEAKAPSRATLDGVQTAIAINSYLTFSIGAGSVVIGIITDLEARESFDPASGEELSLELLKARRIANVQLLGAIEKVDDEVTFSPGITVLPTLDTAAEIGSPEILKAVFERPPRRNRPDGHEADDFDTELALGCPTGQKNAVVRASYNDLFSRPLAIVGNTGSGKSFTVSSLVQKAMKVLEDKGNEPHIFILDINGEYARAFLSDEKAKTERIPDRIYLNGEPFGVPLWLMNAEEICAWLSASEQTQEPVLKDWWAIAKAKSADKSSKPDNSLRNAMTKAGQILEVLDTTGRPIKKPCAIYMVTIKDYVGTRKIDGHDRLRKAMEPHAATLKSTTTDFEAPQNEAEIRAACEEFIEGLKRAISEGMAEAHEGARTADSPIYVALENLVDPTLLDRAQKSEDAARIEAHLSTLKLRLKTRQEDRRWQAFLNYEDAATKCDSLESWLSKLGLGKMDGPRVSVLDLSMLSHEVLPYACSIIGRILLESREALRAENRYKNPWVLVLEEAHNYARPARSEEDRGQRLSRLSFERIAKEGRKFGLSLIIASQRPSEISPTIISQCANFVSHRLQNPDDIDHFRRIIPIQARRLLDQVTILGSGEAIAFGSAFHIPTRVQFDRPDPGPFSQTAAPYLEWRKNDKPFPVDEIIAAWGLKVSTPAAANADELMAAIPPAEPVPQTLPPVKPAAIENPPATEPTFEAATGAPPPAGD